MAETDEQTLGRAFMEWLLPKRRLDDSELQAVQRISKARAQTDEAEVVADHWADPRIVRRIIEGRGKSSGKLYGYMAAPADRSHVTDFRPRSSGMTREIAR